MELTYSPRHRAERLIATGRVALAGFSLFAIWLDPSTPVRYAEITYLLLVTYLGYALLLVPIAWQSIIPLKRLGLVTHVIDLLAFSLLLYFTEGPNSPFFVYFVFLVLCAALRWQQREVLETALAALAIFIGMGVYANYVDDPDFEFNRFVIRSAYLMVVAIMLGYLCAYEAQLRGELARLAAWPRQVADESPIRELLKTVAEVFKAPRVAMVWEESEEPWRYLGTYFHGEFGFVKEPPDAFESWVAEALAGSDFFCTDAQAAVPLVLSAFPNPRRWRGTPLHPELCSRYAIRSVLALNLAGESMEGYLLILDRPNLDADDLTLGGIVARQLSMDLDQFHLRQRLQQAAVTEERIRLARDLHDGVLQSLTGAALQLQTVHRLIDQDPPAAQQRLSEVQSLIAAEQRDLRAFVRQLKPGLPASQAIGADLPASLTELVQRIERQRDLAVELTVQPAVKNLGAPIAHDIYRIVQEALINAARHAEASIARVALGADDQRIHITVCDDGHGFPFRGRYDLTALTAMQQGPVSLQGRVASLGGELIIESSEAGASLDITLPLRRQSDWSGA